MGTGEGMGGGGRPGRSKFVEVSQEAKSIGFTFRNLTIKTVHVVDVSSDQWHDVDQ